ncbi:hypothetical protein MRS44_001526 [Fusarium solani]|jgi:hypothetical protein|uniref:Mss4-like protein n=1 Tax=Fusarium solani TaxID=169388 RepID=A0A9P9L3K1_FUSSL|nr:Mss4-like protein [Fusarium solani]KAH7273584.1 Mss4-like protein [Fusarium solani]KAJ3471427.1 hypothetical protein MRS44_001526 [Fusarium solani]KAJ4237105.1 hypothetical protein NW759_000225 [Fusarium solani]
MTESSNTKTLEAKCFCGSVHFKVDVPVSSLPFLTHLCHCSLCRYASGAPCIFHAALPLGVIPKFVAPSSEKNMTGFLVGNGMGTWNFCSTCGCHIACITIDKRIWTLSTSIFIDGSEYFHIRKHIYSKSTKDGGIAQALTHTRGQDFIDWNPPDDRPDAKIVESRPEVGEDGKERLRVECKCKGVSFTIPRPSQEVIDDEYMSQFVSHRDKSKWHATFDACDDCRLVNGTHVVGWTFIPLSVCEPPIKDDLLIGTAKTFKSSDEALRSFCGTCGATIFFSHNDRRPGTKQHIVDVATGILRAPEGVMAENWLTWRGRLAWFTSGKRYDKEFAESLQEGMNKMVLDRHGVVDDYNIG